MTDLQRLAIRFELAVIAGNSPEDKISEDINLRYDLNAWAETNNVHSANLNVKGNQIIEAKLDNPAAKKQTFVQVFAMRIMRVVGPYEGWISLMFPILAPTAPEQS